MGAAVADSDQLPTITKNTQVRMSLAVMWGILVCCVVATAFIVRLTGQIDGMAAAMVELRTDSRDLRAQQMQIMRDIDMRMPR